MNLLSNVFPQNLHDQVVERLRAVVQTSQAYYEKPAFNKAAQQGRPEADPLTRLWLAIKWFFGGAPGPRPAPPPEFRDLLPARLITRALLEHHLPSVFRPCRSVEFRHKLATAAEFLAAIPGAFSGVLDLCFCSSALHSACMSDPNRPYLVLAGRYSNTPLVQLPIHRFVLKELRRQPQPYLDAQVAVRETLIQELA
jgi:hypothetical protein